MAKRTPAGRTRRPAPAQGGREEDRPAAPPTSPRRFGPREALPLLALGLLVAVSYYPAALAGFVWDDEVFTDAAPIRSLSGLYQIWFTPSAIPSEGHYWPLVYTTFWLEHKLWGFAPLGYHLVNIALHLANTLLLRRLLLRSGAPGAWWVAAVFAVHPLHVESVAWVIERKDLLAALFYLGAAVGWTRFVEAPGRGRYLAALALFAAGLLCKSIVVTLPAALLIWHWWQQGRVTFHDLRRLLPFFLAGLGIVLADWLYYSAREPVSFDYSLAERAAIAAPALWFYAGKLVWPTGLAVIYPHWDLAGPLAWGPAAAAAALAALLFLARGRIGRGPLAGALYFALTLSPVLGFIDYGYMQFSFVADRFQYLAGIGVLAVLVGAAAAGAARLPDGWRRGLQVLALGALLVLGAMTWRQAGIYRDPLTFYRHIISLNPQARGAHANLGKELLDRGRLEESLAVSLEGVGRDPDRAKVHTNAGLALLKLKRFDAAGTHLRRALKLEPRNPVFLQNLGELLRKQGRYEEALVHFRAALESDPGFAPAHAGLGDALFHLARPEQAIGHLERAVSLQPDTSRTRASRRLLERARMLAGSPGPAEALRRFGDDTEALLDLAGHYRLKGRYEESLPLYRAALENDPGRVQAHAGLGDALYRLERREEAAVSMRRALSLEPEPPLARTLHFLLAEAAQGSGRIEAAAEQYEQALGIDPRFAEALRGLAGLRFGQQRYEEALGLFRTLVEIDPGDAGARTNVGAVLFHLGRLEAALDSFDQALALDPALESARDNREAALRALEARAPPGAPR